MKRNPDADDLELVDEWEVLRNMGYYYPDDVTRKHTVKLERDIIDWFRSNEEAYMIVQETEDGPFDENHAIRELYHQGSMPSEMLKEFLDKFSTYMEIRLIEYDENQDYTFIVARVRTGWE